MIPSFYYASKVYNMNTILVLYRWYAGVKGLFHTRRPYKRAHTQDRRSVIITHIKVWCLFFFFDLVSRVYDTTSTTISPCFIYVYIKGYINEIVYKNTHTYTMLSWCIIMITCIYESMCMCVCVYLFNPCGMTIPNNGAEV